jgi:hypothetical protein
MRRSWKTLERYLQDRNFSHHPANESPNDITASGVFRVPVPGHTQERVADFE